MFIFIHIGFGKESYTRVYLYVTSQVSILLHLDIFHKSFLPDPVQRIIECKIVCRSYLYTTPLFYLFV